MSGTVRGEQLAGLTEFSYGCRLIPPCGIHATQAVIGLRRPGIIAQDHFVNFTRLIYFPGLNQCLPEF